MDKDPQLDLFTTPAPVQRVAKEPPIPPIEGVREYLHENSDLLFVVRALPPKHGRHQFIFGRSTRRVFEIMRDAGLIAFPVDDPVKAEVPAPQGVAEPRSEEGACLRRWSHGGQERLPYLWKGDIAMREKQEMMKTAVWDWVMLIAAALLLGVSVWTLTVEYPRPFPLAGLMNRPEMAVRQVLFGLLALALAFGVGRLLPSRQVLRLWWAPLPLLALMLIAIPVSSWAGWAVLIKGSAWWQRPPLPATRPTIIKPIRRNWPSMREAGRAAGCIRQ